MQRTINVEFEDINQACKFLNEATQDSSKECDFGFKNNCPSITIKDKGKENMGEKKKGKRKKGNEVTRNYHFKNDYKKKGIPKYGHVVLDLSFFGGDKHQLEMNFNFDSTDTTDVSLGRIMSRIENEMRYIFNIEQSGPHTTELF